MIIPEKNVGDALSRELMQLVENITNHSWEYKQEPFQILDNIYYVGNTWVGAYLIDSGEGLILIDSNFSPVMWMLFENIRKLGFDPKDIKLLLLTHGHLDHIGGARYVQSCCDCLTYFPKGDEFMLTERRDLIYGEVPEFLIDQFYDYDKPIQLGNVSIQPVLTPGHTQGCTSLFWEASYQGRSYRVGFHGGLGNNGLSKGELIQNKLPLETQSRFLDSLTAMVDRPVDVFLPAHNSYFDILSLAKQDSGDHSIFIQPEGWTEVMEYRLKLFRELLDSER